MDYCNVGWSSEKIERDRLDRAEKGGKDSLEDKRFRRREEFKMASLVYEAWHAYYLFINNLQMFKGIPSNAF